MIALNILHCFPAIEEGFSYSQSGDQRLVLSGGWALKNVYRVKLFMH